MFLFAQGLLLSSAFGGFLGAIGIAVDGENLRFMNNSVDQCDETRGAWKDGVPLGEDLVGGDDSGFAEIAAVNELKEEVGVLV